MFIKRKEFKRLKSRVEVLEGKTVIWKEWEALSLWEVVEELIDHLGLTIHIIRGKRKRFRLGDKNRKKKSKQKKEE